MRIGKFALFLAVLAAATFAAGTAIAAGLVASNHNMILRYTYGAAQAKKGACSFCHIPHGAGAKLYGGSVDPGTVPGEWQNDGVAAICFECHGTGALPGAVNVTVYDGGAHGNILNALQDGVYGETLNTTGVHGIWNDGTNDKITCTSCHDVHNNVARPFMRAYAAGTGGSAGGVVEGNLGSLCVVCHQTRAENADALTHQNHPTGVDQDGTWTAANIIVKASMSTAASDRIAAQYPPLNVEVSTTAGADHWNLGGKYNAAADSGTPGTGGTTLDCGTCHAVHNNEVDWASATATDGLTELTVGSAVASGGNALQPLSDAPALGSIAPLCAACHNNLNPSGPGDAATFSHPTWSSADASGVWPSGLTGLAPPPSYSVNFGNSKWGGTAPQYSLDCQSCHDVHFSRYTDDATTSYALTGFDCADCHATTTNPDHHPSGVVLTSNNVDGGPPVTQDTYDWSQIGAIAAATRLDVVDETITGFATAGATEYILGPANEMSCGTCHTNTQVHNQATTWVPNVVRTNDESQMCVDCHGTNPSNGTTRWSSDSANHLGTHFVGTITNADFKWAQGSGTAAVPLSGVTPKYGTAGTNGAIICESCHTLKFKTLTAQQRADAQSNNVGDAETETKDNIKMILTPSGNATEKDPTTADEYLCTACHGAAIAIGGNSGSHPVMMMAGWDVAASAYIQAIEGADDDVSLTTTSSKVNCESCHRPHDAAGGSTANDALTRVLEKADSSGGFLNEQGLCIACHGDQIPQ